MNLLFVHLHDMGRYCSPYGWPAVTPNMQRFAESATVFRNAHCAAPTCSPSRAAMLTGQTAHQAGMLGLLHRGFDLADYAQHLGSYLGRQGYQTAYAGVQHEFNGSGRQAAPYQRKLISNDATGSRDEQATRAATAFLEGVGDQPFFLWAGMFYPHRPFLRADPSVIDPDHCQPPTILPDTPETRHDMADYLAALAHVDACFGQIIDALDRNGLKETTCVVLTTDHGIAFPEMKCNLTAHGTGVALIMDFPGNGMRGCACDALVSHIDVFPTLCEVLDLPPPDHLIGHSMVPLLNQETEAIREDIFAEVNWHAGRDFMRSVRTQNYNYIRIFDEDLSVATVNIDDGPSKDAWLRESEPHQTKRDRVQLYHLAHDPQERHNLAHDPAYAGVLAEMEERLHAWMTRTADPLLHGPIRPPQGAIVEPRNG